MFISWLANRARFAFWALVLLALPSVAIAEESVCKEITASQNRIIDTGDLLRLQKKETEITALEARFGRAFKAPIAAMKEFVEGVDSDKKRNLSQYRDFLREQANAVAARHGLHGSKCLFKNQCSSDGTDSSNFNSTSYLRRMSTDFHTGKPAVVSCNYERALGKFYLSDEELEDLRKDSPELAAYFATDLGWKNACLRIPLSADGKTAVWNWKEFSKKVATAIWRTRRTAELDEIAALFDQQRAESGCLADGGAFEFTDSKIKPDFIDFDLDESGNLIEVTSGSANASDN